MPGLREAMVTVRCSCRLGGGYWYRVDLDVPEVVRERVRVDLPDLADYHARGRTTDRCYARDNRTRDHRVYMSRIAEYMVGRLLYQRVAKVQTTGALIRRPDLEGGIGVRWSSYPFLVFRGRRYERKDPLDEPEVLTMGDEHVLSVLGWLTMREVSPDYSEDSPYWYDPWECWRVPVDDLHLMPTPPGPGRSLAMRHRTPK